mgnify:FL=1
MNIRNYIMKNLKDCNENDIKETILSSVNSDDEVILPGLGVLFEIVWNHSTDEKKEDIINILHQNI